MNRRFAFVTRGGHPSKSQVLETLRRHFPDYGVDVIHVGNLIRNRKSLILVNVLFVLKEYGLEILVGRKKLIECFWRTPYIFRKAKELVSERLSSDNYEFSFQFQSMIDGSRAGLPHYVYTDHTHLANLRNPYFRKTDLYSERWIELERTIYHNATLVFTRTGDVSRSVIEDYGCSREKVFCVYAGSNLSSNFEVDVRRYENKEILFVGFDWERKGGPELIEAFKRVLQVYPDARLVIVGCSPRIRIRNCDVVGVVPLKDLDYYYKKASLFCLPTKIEPSFPIVCLEAFAHGLPVVATNVEGMADIVREEETGYLVKPGDVASLSEVLTRLLGNSEKCRILGENGRRLVLTKYNWENVGAEIARNIVATLGRTK